MNVIKIAMVVILNYGYGINITEQGKIVKFFKLKTIMFLLCKAKINIKSVYLNAYKTIEDIYGTYNYISKGFMKTVIHSKIDI